MIEAGVAEMVRYVSRNWDQCQPPGTKAEPCHKQYHYTDVAIQRDRYDRAYTGTSDHDVVGAIHAAVAVLAGQPVPGQFGLDVGDRRIALLMLAHLVGDIHQPLHVGVVYLGGLDQPVDPDLPGGVPGGVRDTRGGNQIEVGSRNLHAQWDEVQRPLDPDRVSAAALKRARTALGGPARGLQASCPEDWATDTLQAAQNAYAGGTYTHPGHKRTDWTAHFEDRKIYLAQKIRIQAGQLEKAGARLAQVLNAIWP